jgi:hypothetical protein
MNPGLLGIYPADEALAQNARAFSYALFRMRWHTPWRNGGESVSQPTQSFAFGQHLTITGL